ncbi:hypothetical protein TRICI_006565 [Trichomonascus ciferrii]|uniref:Dynactin subunit 4 n=1 Tax=Trichomonascus ciferrii TaxID=44093 RepID=A0A642UIQ0_9ASCO|nr:hypothetical protein TRICI_006565 [Trichomonascus ciferrii]
MKYPRIEVFCPCMEDPDNTSSNVPATIWDRNSCRGLEWLYFCDYCQSLRCPRCIQEEIICRYCPNCLFEVTSQTAKAEENACSRNCFDCPLCKASMRVISRERQNEDDAPTYELICNHCEWKSGDQNMVFTRHPSLVTQVAELEAPTKTRFKELQKYNHQNAVEQLTKENTSTFTKIIDKKKRTKMPLEIQTQELDSDNDEDDNTKKLIPVRRRLRTKRAKRCMGCRQMLVRPESKPTSIGFKVRQLAMNHLPSLAVTSHSTESYPSILTNGALYTFRLTVSNIITTPIKVTLATLPLDSENHPHKVTIISPTFDLGPAPELWDEASLVRGVPSSSIVRETNTTKKVFMEGDRESGTGGIYERGKNWVTVLMEIVPSASVPEVDIPLFVSYSAEDLNIGFWTMARLGQTN